MVSVIRPLNPKSAIQNLKLQIVIIAILSKETPLTFGFSCLTYISPVKYQKKRKCRPQRFRYLSLQVFLYLIRVFLRGKTNPV
jgi:hypothetical protein